MERVTHVKISHYEDKVRRHYNKLINGTDTGKIIDLLFDNGFRFISVFGEECHDIGDQDYFSGNKVTDDPSEIKSFISNMYGEWRITTYWGDKKVRIENVYISVWDGIVFTYPASIENKIEHVFNKFEEMFCYDKTVIINE